MAERRRARDRRYRIEQCPIELARKPGKQHRTGVELQIASVEGQQITHRATRYRAVAPAVNQIREGAIAGKLLIGATTIPVSRGADSSVTLSGKLSATTELDISLQRVQGAPRTPEEKVIKLVPQLQGRGARVCPILQNTDGISNMEACKDLASPTYFHL